MGLVLFVVEYHSPGLLGVQVDVSLLHLALLLGKKSLDQQFFVSI
jgi:hypothetical protein